MSAAFPRAVAFQVVLADANVLYSRVIRDYLLYAMAHQLIRIVWSAEILEEVIEHLGKNVDGFDEAAGKRLALAMNGTFPHSQVGLAAEAISAVSSFELPDEDDRHVLVAAVAAEVALLCSDDLKGFPQHVMDALSIEVLSADRLLSRLIEEAGDRMNAVHRQVVAHFPGATSLLLNSESPRTALRGSAALRTSGTVKRLVTIPEERRRSDAPMFVKGCFRGV